MPRYIIKLAADEYVEWSTIVDAPVTYACERAEAVREWGEDSVARADEHVTSMFDRSYWAKDSAEAVALNRAGEDESELTLAQLREQYSAEAGVRYAAWLANRPSKQLAQPCVFCGEPVYGPAPYGPPHDDDGYRHDRCSEAHYRAQGGR